MPDTKVINFEGVDHEFPSDFSDEDIKKALTMYHGQHPPAPAVNTKSPDEQKFDKLKSMSFFDRLKSTLGDRMKGEYETALSGLPAIGGIVGGIPGAAAGASARQTLTSGEPSLVGAGIDTLTQGVLPGAMSAGKSFVSRIAKKFVDNTNPAVAADLNAGIQKFIQPEAATVEVAGQNLRSNIKNMTPQQQSMAVQTPLVNELHSVPYTQGDKFAVQPIKEVADNALSDVTAVRNFKLATGEPHTIENLALNRSINKGYSEGTGKLDADKILTELTGPKKDVYDEAISSDTKTRLTEFLEKAKSFEPEVTNPVIQYAKKKLIFSVPGAIIGHATGIPGAGVVGGATTMYLGAKGLAKLSQSEALGRLALRSLEVGADSAEGKVVSQLLLRGLAGTPAILKGADGKEEKVVIGADGQIQHPVPGATQ